MLPERLSEKLGLTSPLGSLGTTGHHLLPGGGVAAHHILTSPLGSSGATGRHLPGGGVSYKKQYSKNKDTILLPHLKDAGEMGCGLLGQSKCHIMGKVVQS